MDLSERITRAVQSTAAVEAEAAAARTEAAGVLLTGLAQAGVPVAIARDMTEEFICKVEKVFTTIDRARHADGWRKLSAVMPQVAAQGAAQVAAGGR